MVLPELTTVTRVRLRAPPDCWLSYAATFEPSPAAAAANGSSCASTGLDNIVFLLSSSTDLTATPFINEGSAVNAGSYGTAAPGQLITYNFGSPMNAISIVVMRQDTGAPARPLALCEFEVWGQPVAAPTMNPPSPASPGPAPSTCYPGQHLIRGCMAYGPGSESGDNACWAAYDGNTTTNWCVRASFTGLHDEFAHVPGAAVGTQHTAS